MSRWTERDLPVLRALVESESPDALEGFLTLGRGQGAVELGLDLDDAELHDSLLTLREAGYVDYTDLDYDIAPSAHFTGLAITGAGLQALGQWPLFDAATSPETVALFLERMAPEAPSEEETTNMRRAAKYVRSLGPGVFRSLATGAIAAVVRGSVGL